MGLIIDKSISLNAFYFDLKLIESSSTIFIEGELYIKYYEENLKLNFHNLILTRINVKIAIKLS